MFKKLFKIDDSYEFKPILAEIEDHPASPLGRFTFWTVVALVFTTALWLYLGKIDIVVSGRGMVIPDGESKIIQPLDAGVIKKIMVREGDYVKKNQVLVEIDPSATEPEMQSVQSNLGDVNLEVSRLQATTQGHAFLPTLTVPSAETQQELYTSSNSSLAKQLEIKQSELNKIQKDESASLIQKATYESLLVRSREHEVRLNKVIDVIARDEYDKVLDDIQNYTSNIEQLKFKLQSYSVQKKQVLQEIGYVKENFKVENLKELVDRQKQSNQLTSNLQQIKFKNLKQTIVSPVDGYVDTLFIHTIGGVVTPAEKIVAITPVNMPLLVKASISNNDIGFVKVGQPVHLKVDTFSFQKYGMLEGTIKSISKNSIETEKQGPIYQVYIVPKLKPFKVEGELKNLTIGMSLSAEVKVGKRRIIEFFIYPLIKYLHEGLSVR